MKIQRRIARVGAWSALAAICVAAAGAAGYVATANSALPTNAEELRDELHRIVEARDAREASKRYSELFGRIGSDGITRLKESPHDGVAIQSAWEELRLNVHESERPEPLNRDLGHRFVGFVEGRLRVGVPPWWEKMFIDGRAKSRKRIFFVTEGQELYQATDVRLSCTPETSVHREEGKVMITIGNESVTLREDFFQTLLTEAKKQGPAESISACIDSATCYLALHSRHPLSFPLTAIDGNSGTVLWKAKVWAGQTDFAVSGNGKRRQWVTVVARQDRIIVFGARSDAVYVEGFSTRDGSARFRFSTSY